MLRTSDTPFYSCLIAWPLNESEAGGDLALIETSLLFVWLLCCSYAN